MQLMYWLVDYAWRVGQNNNEESGIMIIANKINIMHGISEEIP